jgi:hypothetical protein
MDAILVDCCSLDNPKGLPVDSCRARKVWKLKQRYQRLCSMADRVRGTCMNLAWLEVSDHIFSTLDKLEALGVDTENMEG